MPAHRCPRCDAPFVEITITLGGTEATMRSCSECDQRVWTTDGRDVDLHGVLTDLSVEPRQT